MKTKRIIAAVLSLCMLGGEFAFNAPAAGDFGIVADAAGECYVFNSTTGLLTLKGEVDHNEIIAFEQKENVKRIKAAEGTVMPETCTSLFQGYKNCISIDLKNADTSNVSSMVQMFRFCSSLAEIDISGFDTSNVTNMSEMFNGCSSLTSIDVSGFDTSSLTKCDRMFCSCSALESLDLSSFDTSHVKDMYFMFYGCESLKSLILGNFDTSNVTDMRSMFEDCSLLNSINVSGFNTSNVKDMCSMFNGCSSLIALDLSNFDTSSVTGMQSMFKDCTSLSELTLGENFGDIAEGHRLPNGTGWVKPSDTLTVVSGSGEYAAFPNTDKNIYVRNIPMQGDVNYDCSFKVSDLVAMQKWLLAAPESGVVYWKAGDLCDDGKLDVYDLCDMREKLIESEKATYSVVLKAAGKNKDEIVDIIYNFTGAENDFDRAIIIMAVNNAPLSISSQVTKKEAEQLAADLRAQGAIFSVTQN